MCPVPWLFWSCLPKRYCAFLALRLRYKFDVFPQAPLTFPVRDPCSLATGEPFAQMMTEGRSLLCVSQVDDSRADAYASTDDEWMDKTKQLRTVFQYWDAFPADS